MRLLQLVKGLDIGNFNGGAEKFGLELSIGLSEMGEEVHLGVMKRHDTDIEKQNIFRLTEAGIAPPIFLCEEPRSIIDLKKMKYLKNYLIDNRIQIVHSHFQIGSLIALFLKSSSRDLRLVRTAHISKEWGNGIMAWIGRLLFTNFIFPLAFDIEVGVSQDIVSQISQRPINKILQKTAKLIYNALPEKFFTEQFIIETKKRIELSTRYEESYIIGSVGRLTKRKGYRYLIEAFSTVIKKYPNLNLILVGDGEERPFLEKQIKCLNLSGKVFLVGQQPDSVQWIRKMDLFVLPSLQEGLPTVVLESMICGTPVISTNISGTRELIKDGETGLLVEPANPLALSTAIEHLLTNPILRRQIAEKGFEMSRKFSLHNSVKEYQMLYALQITGDNLPLHRQNL